MKTLNFDELEKEFQQIEHWDMNYLSGGYDDGNWSDLYYSVMTGNTSGLAEGTYTNNGDGTFSYSDYVPTPQDNTTDPFGAVNDPFAGSNYGGDGDDDGGKKGVITIGQVSSIGADADFTMNSSSWDPGYGITSNTWAGTGGFGVSQDLNTGQWSVGLWMNAGVPQAFDHPFASGNAEVYIGGQLIGTFSITDTRDPNGTYVNQAGTIPLNGGFNLPSNYNGEPVTIDLNVGVGNYTSTGNISNNGSISLTIGVPHS